MHRGIIHMWERVQRLGRTFYVPLGRDLRPMGDLALEDAGEDRAWWIAQTVRLAPDPEPPRKPSAIEQLVAPFIRSLLEQGDATTYQIFEAVLLDLQGAKTLDDGAAVDLLAVLAGHFRCYEFTNDRGALLRKWTIRPLTPEDERRLADSAYTNWRWFTETNAN